MAASALAISGEMADAIALLDRGIHNARALGNRSEFCYLAVLRSRTSWLAGQLVEAEADARSALIDVAGEPRTLNTSLAAAVLVDALVERGAIADAAEVLGAFELDGQLPGDSLIEYFVPMARGALRLAEHKPADALQDFLDCGQTLTSHGYTNPSFAQWRAGAVAAYIALGQVATATALASENLDLARAFEAPGAIARALRMVARAAAKTRLDHLAEAANLLATAPEMLEHAHVLIEYGAELSRVGERAAARTPLMDGLELAARSDARPLVSTAQRELRLIGLRPRRTATTGRDALTASELRVASLAAEGTTNRQIAQALFVTARTVEVHLTNAYRKLNIENRGELAAALARPQSSRLWDELA
jgi:ATP/maltotriose-dependent transcriptional regulator MalT